MFNILDATKLRSHEKRKYVLGTVLPCKVVSLENETGCDRIYLLQKYLRCSPIVP